MNINEGRFLRKSRKELSKDLTQLKLGAMLGVHVQYVSNWERGTCSPPAHVYAKLIRILKINRSELRLRMQHDAVLRVNALPMFKGM